MTSVERTGPAGGSGAAPPAGGGGAVKPAPRRRISPVKKFFYMTFVLCATATALEVGLRAVVPKPVVPELRAYKHLAGDLVPSQTTTYSFPTARPVEGPDATTPLDVVTATTTADGLRGPSRRVTECRARVLCLGDSSMMGFGVRDDETMPAILERRFATSIGRYTEVLNAGVVGYTIDDERSYLEEKGLALQADVVVLEVFPNDVLEKDVRGGKMLRKEGAAGGLMRVLGTGAEAWGSVRAGRWLALRLAPIRIPADPVDRLPEILEPGRKPEMFAAWEKEFRATAAKLQEAGIPLVVILTPHQDQVYAWGAWHGDRRYQDRMLAAMSGTGAKVVDLLGAMPGGAAPFEDLYISNGLYDVHFGAGGQKLKADAVEPLVRAALARRGVHDVVREFAGQGKSPGAAGWGERGAGFALGRTFTGRGDTGGIEVRPPAQVVLTFGESTGAEEFVCEALGTGKEAAQVQVWLQASDGESTRAVTLPTVGEGESRRVVEGLGLKTGRNWELRLTASWHPDFKDAPVKMKSAPVILRRPLVMPKVKTGE